jgi:hypothetical protein
VLAVVLYLGIAGQWAFVARGIGAGEPWQRTAILWGLGAVPVFFALRWRAKERPLLEFCVLFVIISMMLGLCQELLLEADRQFGGVSLAASQAVVVIAGLGVFAIPFLFFIGLDIAEFGLRASGWTAQIARSKLGPFARWAPLALLIALVGQRGHTVIVQLQDHLANDPGDTAWKRYVGAAGVVVVILIAWWVIAHRSDSPEIHPERVATAGRSVGSLLVFIFLFPTLLSQLLVELSLVLDTAGLPGGGAHTTANALDFSGWTSDTVAHWLAIVGVGAMAFAWALARRGRPSAALFLAITGGVTVWQYVTSTGRPLAEFESVWSVDHSYLDLYLVGGIVLLGVYWAATRRLTDLRTQVLLMVLVMTALIAHRDFLENPFDTFFGVAGVALFAFTVVFDLLAVGRWANIDSPALPRTSRLFAYLGFVLFSLVLVNWALVTNDLANVSFFTGQGALRGFQLIGQPMLYGVAVVALTLVVRGDDPLTDLEEVEGALTLFGAGAAPPPHPGMRPF